MKYLKKLNALSCCHDGYPGSVTGSVIVKTGLVRMYFALKGIFSAILNKL